MSCGDFSKEGGGEDITGGSNLDASSATFYKLILNKFLCAGTYLMGSVWEKRVQFLSGCVLNGNLSIVRNF